MPKITKHVEKWAISWAVGLSLFMLIGDYLSGPFVSFPIFFIIPTALLTWFRPSKWAIALVVCLSAIRLGMSFYWLPLTQFSIAIILVNFFIRLMVLSMVILMVHMAKQQNALRAKLRILEGILPVCGFCKKIRNEQDKWEPMETFITRNSEAQFSHSLCPSCGREHYPDFCPPEETKAEV